MGEPMNGQAERRKIVTELFRVIPPTAIFETGTFRGATTQWLATLTDAPIHSVESQPRYFGFAQQRTQSLSNVHLNLEDSREMLRRTIEPNAEPIFAYLDAHWEADLPLAEEIDIVFERNGAAMVMVDDFRVDDDKGYQYDDYGPGAVLEYDYIKPAIQKHALAAWWPASPSERETGARRGCVVLAQAGRHDESIDALDCLRRVTRTNES